MFIGVSAPNLLTGDDIATMADRSVVFALANPEPEVDPADAARHAAVRQYRPVRLPQPDQQRAGLPRCIPRPAGRALGRDHHADAAGRRPCAGRGGHRRPLNAAYITPSVFHADVHHAVATAVRRAAEDRRGPPTDTEVPADLMARLVLPTEAAAWPVVAVAAALAIVLQLWRRYAPPAGRGELVPRCGQGAACRRFAQARSPWADAAPPGAGRPPRARVLVAMVWISAAHAVVSELVQTSRTRTASAALVVADWSGIAVGGCWPGSA